MRNRILWVLSSCWLFIGPVLAAPIDHQAGHDRFHAEFYSKLYMEDGTTSCCNEKDCRPTPHRFKGNGWQVKVQGTWITPPDHVIQYKVTPDGEAHTCGYGNASEIAGETDGFLFFCVIIPPGTG